MKPLKIVFLWHQHQPYYKMNDKFVLPWTRLHGVKDYFDLPEILHEFPKIKQTFNLVPSLLTQIDDYISGDTLDRVQELTLIKAEELTNEQKREILNLFFMCNKERMIDPYPRYFELYDLSRDKASAVSNFSDNEWRDLQVWYNLTWFGPYSKMNSTVHRIFTKKRDFTEAEKRIVLDEHIDVLKRIIPQHKRLMELDQIEVSCTPFYHPIIPLLCDSKSARESHPELPMPDPIFSYPGDAHKQIDDGLEYYRSVFGKKTNGMWPSEGSVSDAALDIFAGKGLKWVATDEEVLINSLNGDFKDVEKFFPHKYKNKNGDEIAILFRDHFLSDRIGFTYSQWNPKDAAADFIYHLKNIRNEIINVHGEEALQYAAVPVILDGENCWEFYENNGVPFLRELYGRISRDKELKTVTCSEAVKKIDSRYAQELSHIQAGSWINGDFNIWIGHEDDRKAWSMLGKARKAFEEQKEKLDKDTYNKAFEALMIAEGSDWFWWYGPEHNAENKQDFDTLFRYYIEKVYNYLQTDVPANVNIPITKQTHFQVLTYPSEHISPNIDGIAKADEWGNAGLYNAKGAMSAMHQVGEVFTALYYGMDNEHLYFRFDIAKDKEGLVTEFTILEPVQINFKIVKNGFSYFGNCSSLCSIQFAVADTVELAISRDIFNQYFDNGVLKVNCKVKTVNDENEIVYPAQGDIELIF